jgi:hypothetical protein
MWERFGVEITTTMVIRRGSQQRMIIASGVEAYPNLAQMAIRRFASCAATSGPSSS